MTDLASPSPEELAHRRRTLRRQRRIRNLQTIWRVSAVVGMAAGTLWLLAHPLWLLRSSDQVIVEGNEILSDEAIQALLPFDYPQPLIEVKPNQLAQFLNAQSPIAAAQITRHLFPPHLEIYVQERQPVAVTVPSKATSAESESAPPAPNNQPGLLDAQGIWMPQNSFTGIDPDFMLPTLRVRGYDPRYEPQWPSLYQAIQQSPVQVSEIDWRMPSNLILETELGKVHLGIYSPHIIPQQLSTLDRLRSLSQDAKAPPVEYIDLSNPQTPAIKVVPTP